MATYKLKIEFKHYKENLRICRKSTLNTRVFFWHKKDAYISEARDIEFRSDEGWSNMHHYNLIGRRK